MVLVSLSCIRICSKRKGQNWCCIIYVYKIQLYFLQLIILIMGSWVPATHFNISYSLKCFCLDVPSPPSHPFFPRIPILIIFLCIAYLKKKKKAKAQPDSPWCYIKVVSPAIPPTFHTLISTPFDPDED